MAVKENRDFRFFTEHLKRAGFEVADIAEWNPFPYQVPPAGNDWRTWLLLGGRGAGKTEAGARYCLEHLRQFGTQARILVGAPTYADARDVCATGPSGLLTIARPGEFEWNSSIATARHSKGGYVKFMSAEEENRWNGPQASLLWADELALWRESSWHMAQFGVRLGERPHVVATTTPKARKLIRELAADPTTIVTHGASHENTALAPSFYARLQERYGGSRLGRQELLGEFIDDLEGALFRTKWIDDARVKSLPMKTTYKEIDGEFIEDNVLDLSRVVVAVDPAVTNNPNSDETGICVAGINEKNEFYIIHAEGYKLAPHQWGARILELYDQYSADRIIAEVNNGGDMVAETILRVAENQRRTVSVHTIRASRGKALRAEPVAALYEQGRVHHVGVHKDAEEQLTGFPIASTNNDDLVDAIVYAISELAGVGAPNIRFL